MIQWFLAFLDVQKQPWPFTLWAPKICCILRINSWIELIFLMLTVTQEFVVRLIPYSLAFKWCRSIAVAVFVCIFISFFCQLWDFYKYHWCMSYVLIGRLKIDWFQFFWYLLCTASQWQVFMTSSTFWSYFQNAVKRKLKKPVSDPDVFFFRAQVLSPNILK